jgi:hypothetical protein
MVLAHDPLSSIESSGEGLSTGSNLNHFWTQLDLDLGITPQINLHTARYDWTDPSRLMAKFQAERTLVVIDVVESNPVERAEDIPAWEPADRATLWAELQNQTLEPSSAKISQSTLIESIASLDRKCLIEIMTEQENVLFTLQPMVMKYVRRNWA